MFDSILSWFTDDPIERITLIFLVLNRVVKATPWHKDDDVLDAIYDVATSIRKAKDADR